jgi:vitellogenic carboxypeptidase-like protein
VPPHVLLRCNMPYSVATWRTLLQHGALSEQVLIYSGQNDIILGAPLTEQFLYGPTLAAWSRHDDFIAAAKKVWYVGVPSSGGAVPDLAGYVKNVGNVTYAVVRGAGHMVPGDQPSRAKDLIDRFITGTPF